VDLREKIILTAGILFLAAVIWRLFRTPIRLVGRVALNSLLGFAVLWLLQLTAPVTGFSLGVNGGNAAVIAVLGTPGLGLLLLLQWLFT
jgi:inhibitor of the pro-sigma K processing machinery